MASFLPEHEMSDLEDLERRCRDLESLHELATDLLQLEDYGQMLDAVVHRALSSLQADRGFLVLKHGEQLEFKVVRNWSQAELEAGREPVSRAILLEVLRSEQPLLVRDALTDPRFSGRESVLALQIRSVLAAPLELEGRIAGVLYLESSFMEHLFGVRELELFQRILQLSSRALQACLRRIVLEQRNALLEKDLLARYDFPGLVTRDVGFLKLLETVAQVAPSGLPVLVQGPSGSGKELVVRAIHLNSPRSKRVFLTLNCGAISPQLLESELFGHVRGAFTGAASDKLGLVAAAHGGTLFLDEVAELPKELQTKLLRTLQFGEVQPVGSTRTQTVDVRFVAATNRDLAREVQEGRFREDLFYRLNAITLQLPALKDRRDDIVPLFYHFLGVAAEKAGRPVPPVAPAFERVLRSYDWPGNVRELENEAYRLLTLTRLDEPLAVERLSSRIAESAGLEASGSASAAEREKERIELALRLAEGNRTHAARALGFSRETLRQKMKRYGVS
jgi:transcriptional regulator with GAF, ATPase, and Fis domain